MATAHASFIGSVIEFATGRVGCLLKCLGKGLGHRSIGFESLVESFRCPTLEDGKFICRDAVAPITQVLSPPPAAAAEYSVIREIKRGYLDAMKAVQDAKAKLAQQGQGGSFRR